MFPDERVTYTFLPKSRGVSNQTGQFLTFRFLIFVKLSSIIAKVRFNDQPAKTEKIDKVASRISKIVNF